MIVENTPGKINLTPAEIKLLEKTPKYQVLDALMEEEFEVELEILGTKLRWSIQKDIDESLEEDEVVEDLTAQEEDNIRIIEASTRQVYDRDTDTVDLSKRRTTDLPNNSRIILPKPLPPLEEAKLNVRLDKLRETFAEYMKKNCDSKGRQASNLTWELQQGLLSLKSRIKKGELLVCPSDKSGKLVVTDPETYLILGSEHTKNDTQISQDEVARIQQTLNGHQSMLIKGFNIGGAWNHTDRVRESTISQSNAIPPLYLMIKDHKEVPVGDFPKTRPVVSNCRGMGASLSNTVSDIVESLAISMKSKFESISTEDYLARTDKYNEGVKQLTQPPPTNPQKVT